jgi:putative transposase
MSQSFVKVPLHVVFSTKDRLSLIAPQIEQRLYQYIYTVCRDRGFPLLQIGGMPDHLHLLVAQSRTISIAKTIEVIKSNSSRWVKQTFPQYQHFTWQRGYAAFAVDEPTVDKVKNYIAGQKEHHVKRSFKDELKMLLKRSHIEYDEENLWD